MIRARRTFVISMVSPGPGGFSRATIVATRLDAIPGAEGSWTGESVLSRETEKTQMNDS